MRSSDTAPEPFRIRQAVVALELGSSDEAVLNYLDFLATQVPVGAAYFVHVLPKFDLFNALYEREQESLVSNYQLNEEVIARMKDRIRDRVTQITAKRVDFDVREGDPLEELLKDAEELPADLVVIGQKSGTEHHGILARNLARKVSCNALIIPERAENRLRRILVPVDFSANSVQALRAATALRRQLAGPVEIICVNVFDMPNFSVYRVQKSRAELKHMLEEDRQEAFRAFLHTHVPDDEADIRTVLVEREHPGIASYILDYAEKHDIDLIVAGAKGHSKVELLLLGSVTERLLSANDRIPTLVVKSGNG